MYQVKIFTGSTPSDVETKANEWLKSKGENNGMRLVQANPTDVVQFSSTTGIQRFNLVMVYELVLGQA